MIRHLPAGAVAVTKDDEDTLDLVGLYVGGTGDVNLVGSDGVTVKFESVPAGSTLWLRIVQVLSTGTTATKLVGYVA